MRGRQGRRDHPEGLAQQSLDAVALDRTTHPPPDRDPEARRQGIVRRGICLRPQEDVEDQVACSERASLAEGAVEVGTAREPSALASASGLALARGSHA